MDKCIPVKHRIQNLDVQAHNSETKYKTWMDKHITVKKKYKIWINKYTPLKLNIQNVNGQIHTSET